MRASDQFSILISYERAPDVEEKAREMINALNLAYVDPKRLHFYRSKGSRARRVQARIHGLGRIWFDALSMLPNYVIEVISEEYDRLDSVDKDKVIIHELMHIPSGFGGGFVPHKGRINRKTVEALYEKYLESIEKKEQAPVLKIFELARRK